MTLSSWWEPSVVFGPIELGLAESNLNVGLQCVI